MIYPNAPAFPTSWRSQQKDEQSGLTIRAHFAAMAMQGYLSADVPAGDKEIARWSVEQADALIAELNK